MELRTVALDDGTTHLSDGYVTLCKRDDVARAADLSPVTCTACRALGGLVRTYGGLSDADLANATLAALQGHFDVWGDLVTALAGSPALVAVEVWAERLGRSVRPYDDPDDDRCGECGLPFTGSDDGTFTCRTPGCPGSAGLDLYSPEVVALRNTPEFRALEAAPDHPLRRELRDYLAESQGVGRAWVDSVIEQVIGA